MRGVHVRETRQMGAAPHSLSSCGACLAAWPPGSSAAEAEHFESIATTWTINNKQLEARHQHPPSTFPSLPPPVRITDRGPARFPARPATHFPLPTYTAVAIAVEMGKKKRGHPDVEELLGRPWCYYCLSPGSMAGASIATVLLTRYAAQANETLRT